MGSQKDFIEILSSSDREGMGDLTKFLEESTFFSDPASCSEHNCYDGGLSDHSMNVYQILTSYVNMNKTYIKDISEDSFKIIGLLHDVNKIGTFQKVSKNVTVKGKDGKNRTKENGKLLFIEKEGYEPYPKVNLPYFPGQLTTQILKQYIKLTKLEDLALQWCSGTKGFSYEYLEIAKRAQATHRVILYTQFAKKEATLFFPNKV